MDAERLGNSSQNSKKLAHVGWVRLNRLLLGGFVPLIVAIAATVVLACVGAYLRHQIYERTSRDYRMAINAIADQKVRRVLQWIRWQEIQMRDWGRHEGIQRIVRELSELSDLEDPELRKQKLRESPAQVELEELFRKLSLHIGAVDNENKEIAIESTDTSPKGASADARRTKYAIWNRDYELLTDFQFRHPAVALGEGASSTGIGILSKIFQTGQIQVELPQPAAKTISKGYPLESRSTYVMFFVPIYLDEDDATPSAAMMIRSDAMLAELEQLLADLILKESNCYLVSDEGVIATPVLDKDLISSLPPLRPVSNPATRSGSSASNGTSEGASNGTSKVGTTLHPIIVARDPGGDLIQQKYDRRAPSSWPLTRSAKDISRHQAGQDFDGYRDYRGKKVVGAWRWMSSANAGLILEIPYEQAYGQVNYINRAFLVMISVPVLTALGLILFSIARHYFRPPDLQNRTLGAYFLERKIGEGGLGVVYSGEHNMLGRKAAIKVIKPSEVSSESIRRFEREVRLASILQHPNAVGIYDFGVSKDGTLYCAMELVDGETLAHLLQHDPHLPFARIVHILYHVSSALGAAHRLNLVHRDIKPQNIMIARTPIQDTIKVVDFGLAMNVGDSSRVSASAQKSIIGTPGFIAPERIDQPGIADPKIDIFSFGVLGLYLLASRMPPLGITRIAFDELIVNPWTKERTNNPDIELLITLLLRCASAMPEQRFDRLSSVSEELRRFSLRNPWSIKQAETWWQQYAHSSRIKTVASGSLDRTAHAKT